MPLNIQPAEQSLIRKANVAVAAVVRDAIINGDLAPGERIKEDDIARSLGVSRTPVREALLLLAAEQLIEMGPGRGSRATVSILEPAEHRLIYEIRALLEGHAAGCAAERIAPEALAAIEASCDRMESAAPDDIPAIVAENVRFHEAILEAAGADRLTFIVRTQLQVPLAYRMEFWSSENARKLTQLGHRRVVKALRAGDAAEAGEQMRRHLHEVSDASLGSG